MHWLMELYSVETVEVKSVTARSRDGRQQIDTRHKRNISNTTAEQLASLIYIYNKLEVYQNNLNNHK